MEDPYVVPRLAVVVGLLLGNMAGILSLPSIASAVSRTVVISEVQMAGSGVGRGSDEFIEFYNASDTVVNLEKWTLRYHSLTSGDCTSGWVTKYTFPKITIDAHGYWLIAANGYSLSADARYTAGLASTGGAIRISDATGMVVDDLGWGSMNTCAEGTEAVAVPDGKSLERRPGEDVPTGGNATDTDDNQSDFMIRAVPEPQSTLAATELPVVDVPSIPTTYLPLEITELLVDPISPQLDANDEYIELHNPNPEPVQVAGYVLATSTSSYHLLPTILEPGEYAAIPSRITHLSLSNAGGKVTLSDPLGIVLDESASWETAVPGATWALFEDGWTWSTQPTPGMLNLRKEIVPEDAVISTESNLGQVYAPLKLNEVFPDPAAPLTDANNEFIELFNPGTVTVSTLGYVIKTGNSLGSSFVLPDEVIPAGGYLAFTSADTTVSLANDGSTVALFNPNGSQIDVVAYTTAPTGQSYALLNDGWTWTTTPTANAANIYTEPVLAASTTAKTKVAKSSSKKGAKVVAAKKVATKKVTTKKSPASSASPGTVLGVTNQPNNNPWLLFVLVGLTIAYIIYEFRYDLRNYYHQLRRYAGSRL